jgi:hypothetical protein
MPDSKVLWVKVLQKVANLLGPEFRQQLLDDLDSVDWY